MPAKDKRKEETHADAGSLDGLMSMMDDSSDEQASTVAPKIEDTFEGKAASRIAFLGSGQAGGNMAHSFWEIGYRRVTAFNLWSKDFEGLAEEMPKLFVPGGEGAHKDPKYAAAQLKKNEDNVLDLMASAWGSSFDRAMICAGLGGGTGSGTCVPLAELARKYMQEKGLKPAVGALVALPKLIEGQVSCRNVVEGLKNILAADLSPLVIIDNSKLDAIYKPSAMRLFSTANTKTALLFHMFNMLANQHSRHITFDKSEYNQLLDSNLLVIGHVPLRVDSISSPSDVSSEIRNKLADHAYVDVDLRKASKGACIFVASESVLDRFSMDFFEAGYQQVDRMLSASKGKMSVLHRGLYQQGGNKDSLQCYIMLAGMSPPLDKLKAFAQRAGMEDKGRSISSIAEYLGVGD